MKNIDLHDTKLVTLPWRYQGARVAIVHPDAEALWAALKADRTLDGQDAGTHHDEQAGDSSPSPSTMESVSGKGISVAVYNGTTVAGLAARAADVLGQHGFTVTSTSPALVRTQSKTVIEYGPGQKGQAEKAAQVFVGAEVSAAATPGIKIILGKFYAAAPAAPPFVEPSVVPSGIAGGARSAADDPCSDLSYGSVRVPPARRT